jgi:tRNA-dihydrouridine synthase B
MLRIGSYEIEAPAVLAPMAGVTDLPYRILCRSMGAGLAATEMLSADMRLWSTSKSRHRMDHTGEPGPRVVQLAGSDPQQLALAARANVDLGAQIIDINMGCPAKKVYNRACGSALLADEPLIGKILDAVVRAVDVPVTLKIRTGTDRAHINGVRVALLAEAAGIQALAVHGRTRVDMYEGAAEYATIRDIVAAVRIPVLANGDIDTPQKARAVLDFTGAQGVMLGRAAQGAPWIFRDVNSFLMSGAIAPPLLRTEMRAIILSHLEALYEFHGEVGGVRIARKHLGWYCRQHTRTMSLRPSLMAAENSSAQFAAAMDCFDAWAAEAA